jgi:hypothetical protein
MLLDRTDGYSRRALEYASAKDFCTIFHQDMSSLYWLALTLTADEAQAEQCFVAGLKECVEGNVVFKEWARSWSRRVVIKNTIRLVSPRPGATGSLTAIPLHQKPGSQAAALLALKNLQPFDRFVFVISVLEGYKDRDCAALLGCSSTEVVSARIRALQQLPQEVKPSRTVSELPGGGAEESLILRDVEVA